MAMTLQSGLSSTGTTRGSALFFLLGRRLGATKDRSATTLGGKSSATSDHRRRRPMTSVVASAFSVASSIVSASPRRAGIVIFDGRRHFHESAKTMLTSSSSYRRTTPRNGRRGGGTGGNNKGLFTPSPFARSSRIIVNDEFAVFRDLMEGNDEIYGMRRYLLLRRSYDADGGGASPPGGHDDVVASLHANKNVLFGSRLHHRPDLSDDIDYYDHRSRYLDACGTLLDVAKEDASINGQQVQALASLDGLCAWVSECLDSDDGGGSDIIAALMAIREDAGGRGGYETGGKTRRTPTSGSGGGGRANQHIITPPAFVLDGDDDGIPGH
ncbi:hypothetical protein ACHAXA_008237 [Cyclostephanos tholiformis]|uniref:Uncharacterized protein n=1 Tax=Cyclostephanos tholiformis TaxID=382380 RepID=A0ABD3R3A1_9STRA